MLLETLDLLPNPSIPDSAAWSSKNDFERPRHYSGAQVPARWALISETSSTLKTLCPCFHGQRGCPPCPSFTASCHLSVCWLIVLPREPWVSSAHSFPISLVLAKRLNDLGIIAHKRRLKQQESLSGDEISEFRHLRALHPYEAGVRCIGHAIRGQSWDQRAQVRRRKVSAQYNEEQPSAPEWAASWGRAPQFPQKVCKRRCSDPLSRGDLAWFKGWTQGPLGSFQTEIPGF